MTMIDKQNSRLPAWVDCYIGLEIQGSFLGHKVHLEDGEMGLHSRLMYLLCMLPKVALRLGSLRNQINGWNVLFS